MKIFLVSIGIDDANGWSRYTKTLADGLIQHGHDVRHAQSLGNPLAYFSNPFQAFLKAGTLKKQIKNFDPDIIHFTVEPYSAMLPRLGKTIAAKSVLTVHGSYGVRMFEGRKTKRSCRVLKHIGKIIAVSQYSKKRLIEEVQKQCGSTPNISVVKNGTVLPKQMTQPKNATKQIICVGGVKPRKGILEALKAYAHYIKNYDTDVHFSIIGDYDKNDLYVQGIQNFIYGQSLNDFVTLTGKIGDEDLQSRYERADLYLMPAKTSVNTFEGFGLVYIEAAGYGIPCIGTDNSGAAEAIDQGVSGLMFDPQDSQGIAKGMDQILNEGIIKRENCRKWAEKHSAEIMTRNTLDVYQKRIDHC